MRKQIEIVIEKSETGREAENASECSHVFENETEGNNRGKREISPGISKMRKIFEAEQTEVRGEDVKQVSNVSKLKNSLGNKSREIYKQEELRERKKVERRNKREEVTRRKRIGEKLLTRVEEFEKDSDMIPADKKEVSCKGSKRKMTEECEKESREERDKLEKRRKVELKQNEREKNCRGGGGKIENWGKIQNSRRAPSTQLEKKGGAKSPCQKSKKMPRTSEIGQNVLNTSEGTLKWHIEERNSCLKRKIPITSAQKEIKGVGLFLKHGERNNSEIPERENKMKKNEEQRVGQSEQELKLGKKQVDWNQTTF